MPQSIHALTLGNAQIRQLDGLFSLNDLHVAAGKGAGHKPGNFLQIDQTKALIAEIETAGIPAVSTREGRNGGTYACRELVIAYAAWISAAFHLKVIRVFLDAQTAPSIQPMMIEHQRITQALDVASQLASRVQTAAFQAMLHGTDPHDLGRWVFGMGGDDTPTVRPLPGRAFIVNDPARLAAMLTEPGALQLTAADLSAIAHAATQKLAELAAHGQHRRLSQPR